MPQDYGTRGVHKSRIFLYCSFILGAYKTIFPTKVQFSSHFIVDHTILLIYFTLGSHWSRHMGSNYAWHIVGRKMVLNEGKDGSSNPDFDDYSTNYRLIGNHRWNIWSESSLRMNSCSNENGMECLIIIFEWEHLESFHVPEINRLHAVSQCERE